MKHFFTFLVVLSFTGSLYAQSVNDYKYVIVPEKYEFLKSADEHQLNSLTTFLFNKYGFDAYLERDIPFALESRSCSSLYANVESDSNFTESKLAVVLTDCNGAVVFKSSQGRNKDKDYKSSYHKALREAFLDIEDLKYKYSGGDKAPLDAKATTGTVVTSVKTSTSAEQGLKTENSSQSTNKETKAVEREIIIKSIPDNASYASEDGFYKAVKKGATLTFLEGSKTIGESAINLNEAFEVKTSEFSGMASFLEGRVVIKRKIKGVSGVVEMIFIKE